MSSNPYFYNDGGIYMPDEVTEQVNGLQLANEVDSVFSSENPEEYMRMFLGDPKIEFNFFLELSKVKERIGLTFALGIFSVAGSVTALETASRLMNSIKY